MNDTPMTDARPRRFAGRKARIGIAAAIGAPLVAAAMLAATIPASAAAPQPDSTPVASVPAAVVQSALDTLPEGAVEAAVVQSASVTADEGSAADAGWGVLSVASGEIGSVVHGEAHGESLPVTSSTGSITVDGQTLTTKG